MLVNDIYVSKYSLNQGSFKSKRYPLKSVIYKNVLSQEKIFCKNEEP